MSAELSSGHQIITGVNSLAIVALLTYTSRNITEMTRYLEEIRDEIISIKRSHTDVTKRTFETIQKLNKKVSQTQTESAGNPTKKIQSPKIEEINEDVDDLTAAIDELMRTN